MKYILSILFLAAVSIASGKEKNSFAANLIPEDLKTNAHLVVRYDNQTFTIHSEKEVEVSHRYAITILDEEGNEFADLHESYSLLSKIKHLSGRLYDEQGKLLKSMKEKDAFDYSSFGTSYTFHDDSRYKSFSFQHRKYPYTVEFEVTQVLKTTFFLPSWSPQPYLESSVETATMELIYPEKLPVNFKSYLLPAEVKPVIVNNDGKTSTTWTVHHLKADKMQPFSRNGNFSVPTIMFAAEKFSLLGHEGTTASWKDFGKFIFELNKDRDLLPDDKKAIAHNIADQATDTFGKVKLLYEYMQQNTRYVANEYGLSGWQTFDAMAVGRTGYGDCKGLTNYMKALLREVGIKSDAVLISAGADRHYKLDADFPLNTFNHVILCVPLSQDTVWLECTSQQLPAGYLGDFTQDRFALITSEEGGKLTRTPAYHAAKSFRNRSAVLTLDQANKVQKISFNSLYSGLMQDDLLVKLKTQPENKIKEALAQKFSFPSYDIANFSYDRSLQDFIPVVKENVELNASGVVTQTAKRTFVNLCWINNPMDKIFQKETRTAPLSLENSFTITDTVNLVLPEGIKIEAMPKSNSISYPFANYSLNVVQEEGNVKLVRRYEQKNGVFPVEEFKNYQALYQVIEQDRTQLSVVLLNQ